jgi:predicted glutamine amidotransferase
MRDTFGFLRPIGRGKHWLALFMAVLALQGMASACRLAGVMGPEILSPALQNEENAFIRATLLDDSNSLQKESAKRPAKDGIRQTFDIEDLSGVIRKYGGPDGWGLVRYACPIQPVRLPEISRNIKPAYADTQFPQAVSQSLKEQPNIVLAHVRLGSVDGSKPPVLSSVHPFAFKSWTFMHNGDVSGAFSPVVTAKIKQYETQLDGGPKGSTDSERAFYYFLANLYEATGTLDSSQISTETVQRVFAQTVQSLVAQSAHPAKPLSGDVMGIHGHVEMQPACNFIVSDGKRLLASRRILNLYLAQKTLSNHQKVYLVASEQTHLKDSSVQWLSLPENYILSIQWDGAGNPQPELEPMDRLSIPAATP